MRRLRASIPVAALLVVLFVAQGIMVVGTSPEAGPGAPAVERAVRDLVRDNGPFLERIPAPWVVLTVLAGAVIATGVWYALVRWTTISEEF